MSDDKPEEDREEKVETEKNEEEDIRNYWWAHELRRRDRYSFER